MSDRYEIRLAGSGGQGVILAAVILGEAAVLHEGLAAVQSQSYGPEARGGSSKSEVVISKGSIDYPKATALDLQVILTQKSCDEYVKDSKPGSVVIIDDFFIEEIPDVDADVFHPPIVRTAREKIGKEIVVNMVALGAAAGALEKKGIMKPESIRKAILARVPKGTEELNGRAFDEGYALVK